MVSAPPIITCPQWGAKPPRGRIMPAGRPSLVVIHHTDGHASGTSDVGYSHPSQAIIYARQLQSDMQGRRGWVDSGHSFLVMRSGIIIQGRWGTVRAIEHGRMVVSAHCPGQNDQPGIEHEHLPGEPLTHLQRDASVALIAWICACCGIRPTELYPHRHFYATACPDNLAELIPDLRLRVAHRLTGAGPTAPRRRSLRWVLGRRLET